jgi:hypothetical protein
MNRKSFLFLAGLAAACVLAVLSCRSTSAPESEGTISLRLDAVPLLLKADSSSVAMIWATVLDGGRPARDSTMVVFASSLGEVTSEAFTKDGLAQASFTPGTTAGIAAIVAQVMAVRDTVVVTVF